MIKRTGNLLYNRLQGFIFGGHRPDFLIIGAQKSGTTSLFSYLGERKGFLGSTPKEVHFFDREDSFQKGVKWYENHFLKPQGKTGLFFEASPTYLCRDKVPARLKAYNPDLKIIILLREPISRAYSAWNMYRQWSEEGVLPRAIANDHYGRDESPIYRVFFKNGCPSFSDYIKLEIDLIGRGDTEEEPSLLRRGLYKPQIERYVELFGWDNILVLGFNELKNDSEGVIQKCYEFLGLRYQAPAATGETEIKNKRSYPSKMSNEDLEILKEFYEQPNKELFDYLGFQPDW
jgi:hypothetical protein